MILKFDPCIADLFGLFNFFLAVKEKQSADAVPPGDRPVSVKNKNKNLNPFRMKTPKYLFPRGNEPLMYHQIGNRFFLIF